MTRERRRTEQGPGAGKSSCHAARHGSRI